MTKTNVQKYSHLTNEVLKYRAEFYNRFQNVKLDETILNECENLIENLMSVKKHELKTIKKVMKRFFYLINLCLYADNESMGYAFSDRYDPNESYSLDLDCQNAYDNLHSFKDENKLFFERFTFCNYIIEYFNGTSFDIDDIIDLEKITLKNYSYTLSKKLFLCTIHDIFIYFYSMNLICDYNMDQIYYKCNKIYKKINIVRDTLENTNKCITNIGIII
jgi:hypothetical protein